MSEKLVPKCPYCGSEMRIDPLHLQYNKQYRYKCFNDMALAPSRFTEDEAYSAAMQRHVEPLKPLTWEEFIRTIENDPVWMEDRELSGYNDWILPDEPNDENSLREAEKTIYGREIRGWTRRPTNEERRAAHWNVINT